MSGAPRFFNTFTRRVEPLETLEAGRARIYTCGPTVYNHAHIGNFRAYIFEDLLQRHLEFRGFQVLRVMNLTDVDDKTIRGARTAGVALADFTRPFKDAFFADLDALRIKRADHFPEATDPRYIARMIDMIGRLVERGHAYRAEDGSVYFRIRSFPAYGRLAHLDLEGLRPGARVASDEYEKEEVGDFALWKAWQEVDGDVGWESPWGRGRPGWHIECSAMATEILGAQIDIHCGGEDNIFPHHEAEIAQSECCSGLPFAKLWMHCRHLLVDGRKMAKSEGNFLTLRDGIVFISNGSSNKMMGFTSYGDLLQLVYSPAENPRPVTLGEPSTTAEMAGPSLFLSSLTKACLRKATALSLDDKLSERSSPLIKTASTTALSILSSANPCSNRGTLCNSKTCCFKRASSVSTPSSDRSSTSFTPFETRKSASSASSFKYLSNFPFLIL